MAVCSGDIAEEFLVVSEGTGSHPQSADCALKLPRVDRSRAVSFGDKTIVDERGLLRGLVGDMGAAAGKGAKGDAP